MSAGDHDFAPGEIVTAANVDDFLMLQAVQKHATSAARDTALSVRKREGMVTYQDDSNCLTVYTGAAWSTIGPVHGSWTTFAPVITQSGTVAHTDNYCRYQRIGRTITGNYYMTVTGTGTGANAITVTLPFSAASNFLIIGVGRIWDSSSSTNYPALLSLTSTSVFQLQRTTGAGATTGYGALDFVAALTSPDEIYASFTYECSADA